MIDFSKVPRNESDPFMATMAYAPQPQRLRRATVGTPGTPGGAAPGGTAAAPGGTTTTLPTTPPVPMPTPQPGADVYGGPTTMTTTSPATGIYGDVSSYFPQYGQAQGVPLPQQMQDASAYLNAFAGGMPSAIPSEWNQVSQLAGQMATQGPTTSQPWYQSAYGNAQTAISDEIKRAVEQAGMGFGGRFSSATGRNVADIGSRGMSQFQQSYLDRVQQAEEANRQNQLAAFGQLYQTGAGKAGLSEAGLGRGLQAAGMLGNVGQAAGQYGLDLASTAYGMGTGQTSQANQMANQIYNQWLTQQGYNNPWLGMGNQAAFGYQAPYTNQTYQPSGFSQILGATTSMLPFLFL